MANNQEYELKFTGEEIDERLELVSTIKDQVRQNIADIGGKFGSVAYEGGVIRFYDSDGGTQLGAVTITGTSYTVNVETNIASSNFTVLTSDEQAIITLTPTTKSMEFGSSVGEDYPEDYTFKLEVDSGSGYVDRTPEGNSIKQGGSASVDIRPYIRTGINRVRIVVTGASSNQPRTLGYTVTLTSLSLSCSHPWHKVWFGGQEFAITNIFFGGNIAKTLHVKVGDNEYTNSYTASTSYDKVPTSFVLTNNTPTKSGVIPVELWMTGDGVETKHIYYNIMYVATEDIGKVSLICTNNVKSTVYNFSEETLLEYAVYNINSLTSVVSAAIKGETSILLNSTQDVIAQTAYTLRLLLKINTTETEGITLNVSLSSNDVKVQHTMTVDNSNAYHAEKGYKFYLNPSLGNNDSVDKEHIINSAITDDVNYKSIYPSEWENFTFADDAWGSDTDGNRALVVKAGSELTITDLKPLQFSNNKSATIEIMYRASNIADYDTPIITCIDTEEVTSDSVGLIIYPTRVVLLKTGGDQELFQQLPLSEDRIHHIGIVIQRGYAGTALNLARIYINGCENVTFQFTGDSFFYNATGNNQLRIGQQSSDTYLYMMRIYGDALESKQMFANYLNAVIDSAEVDRGGLRDDNNITDGTSVSYDLCKEAGFNCLVIEIEGDKPIPSLKNPVEYSRGCNYHFEYNDNPEWNVSIYDGPCDRQGTTSNLYAMSNLRMKNKKAIRWVYHNLKDAQGNVLEEIGKDGYIAGYGLNARVSRITWKKNIASQPQGHKMGATMMYNDIYKRVMGGADKLVADKILPTAEARVAVYQHPFFGFQKFSNGTYKFIGLYTGGPDKGDKKTFGYNATTAYPSLMMIEGPNHDRYLTQFLVPWTDDVFYDATKDVETLSVGAESVYDGAKEEGWDADIVAGYSSDDSDDKAKILKLYEDEFKPAYDAIYYNSPYIASLAESGKTLSEINQNVGEFQKGKTRDHLNKLMTFYDEDYNLVYYRVKTGIYEVLDKSVHNMLDYLGLSGSPTTDEIVAARKANWLPKVSQVVNMREAYYRQVYDEFIGASDNDAKNSYWRKFLSIKDGGRWGFNEDDLDTIFQNDNNGQDTKTYYVEPDDTSALGADIFQGRTSAFWYALRQNCKDQLRAMFKEMIDAMYEQAESLDLLAETVHQTIFNLIDYYFWKSSSKYFPATAYNQDTQFAYIDVWYENPDKTYNSIAPLTQIHGDHYETEREWVTKRIAYMFSKYQIAAFEQAQEDGYGRIEINPAENTTIVVTPAIALYPRYSAGGGLTGVSKSVKAGETYPLYLDASGTTGSYIKGVDWLADIGDLSDLKLSSRSGADTEAAISFTAIGKRLRRLKVGEVSKTPAEIKFNAATLGVESEALEVLDARNASTIQGNINLQKCPRVREAYLSGTSVNSVYPPTGGRLQTLELPDSVQTLVLNELNLLKEEGLIINETALGNIRSLYVNSCKHINPIDLLQKIYNISDNKLTAIGLIWKGWFVDSDGSILRMFGDIASKAGVDGGYGGVEFTNDITQRALPNISGGLDASGLNGVYQKDIDAIINKLPNLLLKYDPSKLYMSFADPEVLRVLLANNVGDGTGITTKDAAAVTSIGAWFNKNTVIETFYEFEKFTGVKVIEENSFNNCSNLKSIVFPINTSTIQPRSFYKCENLDITVDIPNLTKLGDGAFAYSGIRSIVNLGSITEIVGGTNSTSNGTFNRCLSLTSAILPETLTTIGGSAFEGCALLSSVAFPKTLTTVGGRAFYNTALSDIDLSNIQTFGVNSFAKTKIKQAILTSYRSGADSTSYYQGVFSYCTDLELVDVGENATHIPRDFVSGCTSLHTIIIRAIQPPTLHGEGIRGVDALTAIYVPDASVETYKTATNWGTYADRIYPMNIYESGGVASIIQFADHAVKAICLANWDNNKDGYFTTAEAASVTSLRTVFRDNAEITSFDEFVNFHNVEIIEAWAFDNCSLLESITPPNSIKTINAWAFHNCAMLSRVNFPHLEGTLGVGAFQSSGITRIENLGQVSIISSSGNWINGCFRDCKQLTFADLPATITKIDAGSFLGCSLLTTLIVRATTPPELSSSALNETPISSKTGFIYVPEGSVAIYQTTDIWKNFNIKSINELN